MSIIKTPRTVVKDYYESDAISQSELKIYFNSYDKILYEKQQESSSRLLFNEESNYNIIGSAVDILLTGTQEDFENEFYISVNEKPSDLIISIVKQIYEKVSNSDKDFDSLVFFKDEILEAINDHNYQPKWKEETRINKIIDLGSEYFFELDNSKEKTVISAEDIVLVENIVDSFKKEYPKLFVETDNEVYHQYPVYFMYNNYKCKALLDVIEFKNDGSIIIYDIKTTGDFVEDFPNAFRKFKYGVQSSWYTKAIETMFPNKKVTFKFIVQSKKQLGIPKCFEVSSNIYNRAFIGYPKRYSIEYDANYCKMMQFYKPAILGIDDLLRIRNYYVSTNFEEDYNTKKVYILE